MSLVTMTLDFQSIGTGADSGDKAPYKATTGAIKYALLTAFLIPTGDDPENDSGDRVVVEAAKKIFAEPAKKAPATKQDDLEGLDF